MNKSANSQRTFWCLLPSFTRYSLILLLSGVFLSESVGATPERRLQIAQQSQAAPAQANPTTSETQAKVKMLFEKANQLSQEALQLGVQPNSASQRQAITKNEEVVKIWRLPEVRAVIPKESRLFEASALSRIGNIYANLSENPKAVEYSEQALAILPELKDKLARQLEATALFQVALPYFNMGQKQKALNALEQARSLFGAENQTENVVNTWTATSTIYGSSGEFKKGIEPLNKALEIQKANNLPGQAQTIKDLADSYSQLGEREKALKDYNEVLEIYRQTKDLFGQANILSSLGSFYSQKGERQQAEKYYKEALQLQMALEKQLQKTIPPRVVPDKRSEPSLQEAAQERLARYAHVQQQITILRNISTSYYILGDSEQQITYLKKLQSLNHQLGNTQYEADSMRQIATVYSELGDKQKALGLFKQALEMQRSIKNVSGEAEILNGTAEIHLTTGEPQLALDNYNQALNIFQRLQNPFQKSQTLSNIAGVYKNLGDYDSSIKYYNHALEIYQRLENPGLISTILGQLGNVFLKRPRTASLPEDAKKADYDKALEYYDKARKIQEKEGIVVIEVASLFGIARTNEFKKDYPQAIATAKQALALSRQHDLKYWERSSLTVLGRVYKAAGDYQKGLDSTKESFLLSKKVGDLSEQATTLQIQGEIYTSMKQPQQAIEAYNQELALRKTMGDKAAEAFALYNLAVIERDRGNLQAALPQIEETIDTVEGIRSKVTSQDLRSSYFATVQNYYKFYIDLLMQLHKKDLSKGYNAQALHISERSRARSLIELLTEARANIRKGVDPKLLAEEKRLQQLIDARGKLQDSFGKPAQEKLQKEVLDLLSQQKELQTKIRTTSPKYKNLIYPEPLKLPQIQQQLDKDSLLLEYSLGEERSYLWAVTPNSIDTYELPGRKQIEEAATDFKGLLNKCQEKYSRCDKLSSAEQKAQALKNTALSATKLSKLILAPVADKLGQKRLVIVADGALQTIPFAALNDLTPQPPSLQGKGELILLPSPASGTLRERRGGVGGEVYQPLIVNHEIVNLPSVTTIATQRQDLKGRIHAPKTLAVLADPVFEANDIRITGKPESTVPDSDFGSPIEQSQLKKATRNLNRSDVPRLEGTRKEAEAILKLVPSAERLQAFDFDANYDWVTNKQLSQYRFLLFATHGFADPINPELSGIVLSLVDKQGKPADKGYLRLGDIFNLDFTADLVVLSACDTGLGKDVNGEGLVGLTRGLMYAGAERVAVSLWQVDDVGTSELMQEFYTQMLKQGKSPAVALRAAQLKLWENSSLKNPYYWSAFTLQGEWR